MLGYLRPEVLILVRELPQEEQRLQVPLAQVLVVARALGAELIEHLPAVAVVQRRLAVAVLMKCVLKPADCVAPLERRERRGLQRSAGSADASRSGRRG